MGCNSKISGARASEETQKNDLAIVARSSKSQKKVPIERLQFQLPKNSSCSSTSNSILVVKVIDQQEADPKKKS
jgi:hypothetical protein